MQKRLVPKANTTQGIWRENYSVRRGPGTGFGERRLPSPSVLTLCILAFTDDPEVQQGHALLQQGVGVLHADPVDVIHAELQLAGQLCTQRTKSGCEPSRSPAPAPPSPRVEWGAGRNREIKSNLPLDSVFRLPKEIPSEMLTLTLLYPQGMSPEEACAQESK